MSRPVIVINGLGAPRAAGVVYARALAARGLRTDAAPQRIWGFGDVRIASRLVAETVDRVRGETGADKVDLVGMSLGGLIGLHYLKCGDGGRYVERFVSVGGPLNGSAVARFVEYLPVQWTHAIAQTTPDNEFMRELHARPFPPGVRCTSVGTRGDPMTPRSSWDAPGFAPVETPHGFFPMGHWLLFTHPKNHDAVARCLTEP
jgi:pimeloyl-ACP methyl ester carboxylesterase